MKSHPESGQLVVVRKRPFVVTEIIPSVTGIAPDGASATHLIKLSSVEDDGLGEELQVIWEIEPGTAVHEKSTLPEPVSFDHPKRLQAFLDAVRWGAVSQADDRALQSPFRSGIEVDEYQLEPVLRALSMPRVNLLIADDVGLGKTIEAGLVVQEMILRHRVRSMLIICPSNPALVWKRKSVIVAPIPFPLKSGNIAPRPLHTDHPLVLLQRSHAPDGRWLGRDAFPRQPAAGTDTPQRTKG